MIQSLHIKNFRCFRDLELKDLGKFNVVVGDNGSGKTSLLEAIYLPGNSAQVPMVYRSWRGMVIPSFSSEQESYESLFDDLFFDFSPDSKIEIDLRGSPANLRKATISFDPISEMPLFPDNEAKRSRAASRLFTLRTTDAERQESIQRVNLDGNIGTTGLHRPANIALSTSSGVPNPLELAQQYSNLKKSDEGAYKLFVDTVHAAFPQISELSVELTGATGELFCRAGRVSKIMPLSLMSNGYNKLLFNLLAISAHKGGVALIDEIENGVYYTRLPKVWETLILFGNKFEVQLFVATHSLECLQALRPFLEKDPAQFRLIRTEDMDGKDHTARVFKGENFSAALETGTDVR
jgi:predicted ATPase